METLLSSHFTPCKHFLFSPFLNFFGRRVTFFRSALLFYRTRPALALFLLPRPFTLSNFWSLFARPSRQSMPSSSWKQNNLVFSSPSSFFLRFMSRPSRHVSGPRSLTRTDPDVRLVYRLRVLILAAVVALSGGRATLSLHLSHCNFPAPIFLTVCSL